MTGNDETKLAAEQRARVLIDRQLIDAGWVVQDKKALNLFAAQGVACREVTMKSGHGRADYLLYVDQRVVGVIEAKPQGTTLSGVEWQSAMYAEGLPADIRLKALTTAGRLPFVFEASGTETHLVTEPSETAVPFFKVGDMNSGDGRYMSTARNYVEEAAVKSLSLRLRDRGTVLIPKRGGAIATNKKRLLDGPACYDLNTMGLVPTTSLDPLYLWHWLQGIDLGQLADGSQVPQINAPQIRGLELPVPSLDVQASIVAGLETRFESQTRLISTVDAALDRAATLRRAVLAAAFRGKLTGQHTDEEVIEEIAEAGA